MMDRVAGHAFNGVGTDQRCECGRWWTDIMDCDDSDEGKPHLAHTGDLSSHELSQISAKRKHELRFWDAVEAASG